MPNHPVWTDISWQPVPPGARRPQVVYLAAPQRKQAPLAAKLWVWQSGHIQSPGLKLAGWPPPPPLCSIKSLRNAHTCLLLGTA